MTITGVISAILIGIVVGVLGLLVLPGKQRIGMLLTILVGIVSAFIGTALARALGIPTATNGVDWLELLVQVVVAVPARWAADVPDSFANHLGHRPRDPGWVPDQPGSLCVDGVSVMPPSIPDHSSASRAPAPDRTTTPT